MPKVIAIYLPQFHETEHNNKWWGKGFTDWESVKSAESCFPGHEAPWVPLYENYYDLSQYETMRNQAELAKKYGVGGFCFYHYYFEKGKKELETPAENLLRWKDIDMPFCFNWASESWIRSWSRIDGNVWSEKYEKQDCESTNGVLVRQDYGTAVDWKAHFEYLLPFFKDKRYITVDHKPVFIFYRPNDIKPLEEMVSLWRQLASEAGLEGLYFIGVNMNVSGTGLDASMVYEPRNAINRLNESDRAFVINGVRCFEYQEAWEVSLQSKTYAGCKTYFTGITGYDDTPRRGQSGECMIHNSPQLFEQGMEKLIKKSIQHGNDLVFINAWNEWGEGMYLEPDEKHQYMYLEALLNAEKKVEEELDNIELVKEDDFNEEIEKLRYDLKKYKVFIDVLDKWLEAERNHKIHFADFFEQHNVQSVAIYGMSMFGKQLYKQLAEEGIRAKFGIDRYVGQYGNQLEIIRPEADYPEVDAIIVTAYENSQIIKLLQRKSSAQIFILEDLIEYFWRIE